jgi:glutaminyl-peptide cyclotransferase
MKKLFAVTLLYSISFAVLINCAQPSHGSRKPVTSISFQNSGKEFHVGDRIGVSLKTRIRGGSLRKTELFIDQKSVFTSSNTESSYVLETSGLNSGTHQVKVIATKDDGEEGENFADLLLLSDVKPIKYGYKIISIYPHNQDHFTQGLEIVNGFLYEGTGQEGKSGIFKENLNTGKILQQHKLEDQYFGEGITILNGKLYQLTYKSRIGFVYDANTFDLLKTWTFKSAEGWGLTNDGSFLIMSDGTEYLTYIDPTTFDVIKTVQVCDNVKVVKNLNELEYIKGEIWANVWLTNQIVRIDPKTGKVTGEIDLTGLQGLSQNNEEDVLNGIAYDSMKDKIYVTGKLWPKLYEIKLLAQGN